MLIQEMPPNPTTPRLQDLDPKQVVLEATQDVANHLQWTSNYFFPALVIEIASENELLKTPFAFHLQSLIEWAKTGKGISVLDFPDVVSTVYGVFYTNVANTQDELSIDDESFQFNSPVSVVIAASFARYRLIMEQSVPGTLLAALASLSDARIRQLVADGVLRRTEEGKIDCESAKSWLLSRNISI